MNAPAIQVHYAYSLANQPTESGSFSIPSHVPDSDLRRYALAQLENWLAFGSHQFGDLKVKIQRNSVNIPPQ